MLLLKEIVLPNGNKCLSIDSDDKEHWLNFLTSIEISDAKWLEDALSLKRAYEDLNSYRFILHDEVEAKLTKYDFNE